MGEALYVLVGLLGIACIGFGLWELWREWRSKRTIPIATGAYLDALGTNIGYRRKVGNGYHESDAEYRARIKADLRVIPGGKR